MSFQAYLDNIEEKTGKTPNDFIAMAKEKGLDAPGTKAGAIVAWLKADYGLGRGHAMALVHVIGRGPDQRQAHRQRRDAQRPLGHAAPDRPGFHVTDTLRLILEVGKKRRVMAGASIAHVPSRPTRALPMGDACEWVRRGVIGRTFPRSDFRRTDDVGRVPDQAAASQERASRRVIVPDRVRRRRPRRNHPSRTAPVSPRRGASARRRAR